MHSHPLELLAVGKKNNKTKRAKSHETSVLHIAVARSASAVPAVAGTRANTGSPGGVATAARVSEGSSLSPSPSASSVVVVVSAEAAAAQEDQREKRRGVRESRISNQQDGEQRADVVVVATPTAAAVSASVVVGEQEER
jgi:hypothetical protein